MNRLSEQVWPAIWTKGHDWPNDGEIEYEAIVDFF